MASKKAEKSNEDEKFFAVFSNTDNAEMFVEERTQSC